MWVVPTDPTSARGHNYNVLQPYKYFRRSSVSRDRRKNGALTLEGRIEGMADQGPSIVSSCVGAKLYNVIRLYKLILRSLDYMCLRKKGGINLGEE